MKQPVRTREDDPRHLLVVPSLGVQWCYPHCNPLRCFLTPVYPFSPGPPHRRIGRRGLIPPQPLGHVDCKMVLPPLI